MRFEFNYSTGSRKFVLLILPILVLTACGDSEKDLLRSKYDSDSTEDCLSKYEFEGARRFLSYEDKNDELGLTGYYYGLIKIIDAECDYWIKQKEYKKALGVIDESSGEEEKMSRRFNILSKIIDELIEEGDFSQAKIYALKASDEHTMDGYSEVQTSKFDIEKTQQKLLLKKVENAEKLLSK